MFNGPMGVNTPIKMALVDKWEALLVRELETEEVENVGIIKMPSCNSIAT